MRARSRLRTRRRRHPCACPRRCRPTCRSSRRTSLRYGLIVFDWDGTLIDSTGAIAECIQEAAREMGFAVPDRERARHVIGLGLHASLRHAVPDLPAERAMEFVACYRRHFLAREDDMRL